MTATADDEVTEFEIIEVESIKGVPQGANGFPHLIMKGVAKADAEPHGPFDGTHTHDHPAFGGPDSDGDGVHGHRHTHHGDADHHHEHGAKSAADEALKAVKAVVRGKVDEAPDVDLGKQIMALLGKAILNEAQEVAAGFRGEICDVSLLTQAAELIDCWTRGEETAPIDGASVKGKLSTAQRDNLSDSDFAIPETRSYPIHDEAHARNALSRVAQNGTPSEKAKVRAAVHRKYPDIGDDDDDSGSKKGAVAEGGTGVDTDTSEALTKSDLEAVVTKAVEPLKAELETLRAFKAKVEKTAIPGGPVMSANARPIGGPAGAEADDLAAKAALMRAKADAAVSPSDAAGYRQYARELDEQAAKSTQA